MAFEVVETSRRGDAADYAAAAGDRLVIAVGGDGTAHEVVNGLLRRVAARPPRIGFLQRGTGADLRRTIASPRRPEDVAAWLTTDRWRPLDVGRLSTSTGRRYFINVADAGIGAEVVRRAARGPMALGGTVNFMGAAVISLRVEADGELAGTTPAVFEIIPGALQVIDWRPSGILTPDRARVSD